MTVLIWIGLALIFAYSVAPNLLTRGFGVFALKKGGQTRTIALTFDDGPDRQYTPRLLDLLSEYNVQATFFVIADKALRCPDVIERMKRDGHQVEMHGYRHWFVPLLFPRTAIQQMTASAQVLKEKFGLSVRYYRPTWGLINSAQIYPMVRAHYRLVTWSIMVGDWRVTPRNVLLNRIMARLHPGAILVLHDSDETPGAEATAPKHVMDMLPNLIQAVRQQGYEFVTISNAVNSRANVRV